MDSVESVDSSVFDNQSQAGTGRLVKRWSLESGVEAKELLCDSDLNAALGGGSALNLVPSPYDNDNSTLHSTFPPAGTRSTSTPHSNLNKTYPIKSQGLTTSGFTEATDISAFLDNSDDEPSDDEPYPASFDVSALTSLESAEGRLANPGLEDWHGSGAPSEEIPNKAPSSSHEPEIQLALKSKLDMDEHKKSNEAHHQNTVDNLSSFPIEAEQPVSLDTSQSILKPGGSASFSRLETEAGYTSLKREVKVPQSAICNSTSDSSISMSRARVLQEQRNRRKAKFSAPRDAVPQFSKTDSCNSNQSQALSSKTNLEQIDDLASSPKPESKMDENQNGISSFHSVLDQVLSTPSQNTGNQRITEAAEACNPADEFLSSLDGMFNQVQHVRDTEREKISPTSHCTNFDINDFFDKELEETISNKNVSENSDDTGIGFLRQMSEEDLSNMMESEFNQALELISQRPIHKAPRSNGSCDTSNINKPSDHTSDKFTSVEAPSKVSPNQTPPSTKTCPQDISSRVFNAELKGKLSNLGHDPTNPSGPSMLDLYLSGSLDSDFEEEEDPPLDRPKNATVHFADDKELQGKLETVSARPTAKTQTTNPNSNNSSPEQSNFQNLPTEATLVDDTNDSSLLPKSSPELRPIPDFPEPLNIVEKDRKAPTAASSCKTHQQALPHSVSPKRSSSQKVTPVAEVLARAKKGKGKQSKKCTSKSLSGTKNEISDNSVRAAQQHAKAKSGYDPSRSEVHQQQPKIAVTEAPTISKETSATAVQLELRSDGNVRPHPTLRSESPALARAVRAATQKEAKAKANLFSRQLRERFERRKKIQAQQQSHLKESSTSPQEAQENRPKIQENFLQGASAKIQLEQQHSQGKQESTVLNSDQHVQSSNSHRSQSVPSQGKKETWVPPKLGFDRAVQPSPVRKPLIRHQGSGDCSPGYDSLKPDKVQRSRSLPSKVASKKMRQWAPPQHGFGRSTSPAQVRKRNTGWESLDEVGPGNFNHNIRIIHRPQQLSSEGSGISHQPPKSVENQSTTLKPDCEVTLDKSDKLVDKPSDDQSSPEHSPSAVKMPSKPLHSRFHKKAPPCSAELPKAEVRGRRMSIQNSQDRESMIPKEGERRKRMSGSLKERGKRATSLIQSRNCSKEESKLMGSATGYLSLLSSMEKSGKKVTPQKRPSSLPPSRCRVESKDLSMDSSAQPGHICRDSQYVPLLDSFRNTGRPVSPDIRLKGGTSSDQPRVMLGDPNNSKKSQKGSGTVGTVGCQTSKHFQESSLPALPTKKNTGDTEMSSYKKEINPEIVSTDALNDSAHRTFPESKSQIPSSSQQKPSSQPVSKIEQYPRNSSSKFRRRPADIASSDTSDHSPSWLTEFRQRRDEQDIPESTMTSAELTSFLTQQGRAISNKVGVKEEGGQPEHGAFDKSHHSSVSLSTPELDCEPSCFSPLHAPDAFSSDSPFDVQAKGDEDCIAASDSKEMVCEKRDRSTIETDKDRFENSHAMGIDDEPFGDHSPSLRRPRSACLLCETNGTAHLCDHQPGLWSSSGEDCPQLHMASTLRSLDSLSYSVTHADSSQYIPTQATSSALGAAESISSPEIFNQSPMIKAPSLGSLKMEPTGKVTQLDQWPYPKSWSTGTMPKIDLGIGKKVSNSSEGKLAGTVLHEFPWYPPPLKSHKIQGGSVRSSEEKMSSLSEKHSLPPTLPLSDFHLEKISQRSQFETPSQSPSLFSHEASLRKSPIDYPDANKESHGSKRKGGMKCQADSQHIQRSNSVPPTKTRGNSVQPNSGGERRTQSGDYFGQRQEPTLQKRKRPKSAGPLQAHKSVKKISEAEVKKAKARELQAKARDEANQRSRRQCEKVRKQKRALEILASAAQDQAANQNQRHFLSDQSSPSEMGLDISRGRQRFRKYHNPTNPVDSPKSPSSERSSSPYRSNLGPPISVLDRFLTPQGQPESWENLRGTASSRATTVDEYYTPTPRSLSLSSEPSGYPTSSMKKGSIGRPILRTSLSSGGASLGRPFRHSTLDDDYYTPKQRTKSTDSNRDTSAPKNTRPPFGSNPKARSKSRERRRQLRTVDEYYYTPKPSRGKMQSDQGIKYQNVAQENLTSSDFLVTYEKSQTQCQNKPSSTTLFSDDKYHTPLSNTSGLDLDQSTSTASSNHFLMRSRSVGKVRERTQEERLRSRSVPASRPKLKARSKEPWRPPERGFGRSNTPVRPRSTRFGWERDFADGIGCNTKNHPTARRLTELGDSGISGTSTPQTAKAGGDVAANSPTDGAGDMLSPGTQVFLDAHAEIQRFFSEELLAQDGSPVSESELTEMLSPEKSPSPPIAESELSSVDNSPRLQPQLQKNRPTAVSIRDALAPKDSLGKDTGAADKTPQPIRSASSKGSKPSAKPGAKKGPAAKSPPPPAKGKTASNAYAEMLGKLGLNETKAKKKPVAAAAEKWKSTVAAKKEHRQETNSAKPDKKEANDPKKNTVASNVTEKKAMKSSGYGPQKTEGNGPEKRIGTSPTPQDKKVAKPEKKAVGSSGYGQPKAKVTPDPKIKRDVKPTKKEVTSSGYGQPRAKVTPSPKQKPEKKAAASSGYGQTRTKLTPDPKKKPEKKTAASSGYGQQIKKTKPDSQKERSGNPGSTMPVTVAMPEDSSPLSPDSMAGTPNRKVIGTPSGLEAPPSPPGAGVLHQVPNRTASQARAIDEFLKDSAATTPRGSATDDSPKGSPNPKNLAHQSSAFTEEPVQPAVDPKKWAGPSKIPRPVSPTRSRSPSPTRSRSPSSQGSPVAAAVDPRSRVTRPVSKTVKVLRSRSASPPASPRLIKEEGPESPLRRVNSMESQSPRGHGRTPEIQRNTESLDTRISGLSQLWSEQRDRAKSVGDNSKKEQTSLNQTWPVKGQGVAKLFPTVEHRPATEAIEALEDESSFDGSSPRVVPKPAPLSGVVTVQGLRPSFRGEKDEQPKHTPPKTPAKAGGAKGGKPKTPATAVSVRDINTTPRIEESPETSFSSAENLGSNLPTFREVEESMDKHQQPGVDESASDVQPENFDFGPDVLALAGHERQVLAVCTHKGKLFTGCADGTIKVWEVETGQVVATMQTHTKAVWDLVVWREGDDEYMVSGSQDKTLMFWDLNEYNWLATWETDYPVRCMALMAETMLVIGCGNPALIVLNMGTGDIEAFLRGHELAVSAVTRLDSNTVASGAHDNTIRIWDLETRSCAKPLQGHEGTVGSLAVLELVTGEVQLVSGSVDATMRVWRRIPAQPEEWECLRAISAHILSIWCIQCSPSGGLLATASADTSVKLWNTNTWECLNKFRYHSGSVGTAAFTEDEKYLFSGSADALTLRYQIGKNGTSPETTSDEVYAV